MINQNSVMRPFRENDKNNKHFFDPTLSFVNNDSKNMPLYANSGNNASNNQQTNNILFDQNIPSWNSIQGNRMNNGFVPQMSEQVVSGSIDEVPNGFHFTPQQFPTQQQQQQQMKNVNMMPGIPKQLSFTVIPQEAEDFGFHDRLSTNSNHDQIQNSKSFLNPQLGNYDNNNMNDEPPIMMASVAAAAIANPNNNIQNSSLPANNSFGNTPSRTVYLGNIPVDLSVKDLLDHVRSGVVENVKILPDKMCAFISFVDESSALLFHSDAILKRLNIDGRDIKIGWGKPTPIDPIVATSIVTDGATRNVYIGQLNNNNANNKENGNIEEIIDNNSPLTEEKLREDLQEYGEIDCIKIVQEKGFAFIHMSSILSSIKIVNNLAQSNPYYQNKRIYYGKDRCAFITKTQQHNAAQFLGVQPGLEHLVQFSDRDFISNTLLQQSAAAAAIATSAGGPNNLGNRTVYLGNLPVDVKIDEICNAVRGGLLQHIKLLTDRHVCFVTFIDPTAAAQFYAMSSLHGLTIQKKRCKVGWGKHSGPLPNLIALAVSNGASRNVYLGNIDFDKDAQKSEPIFTEINLRNLFQQYGDVEQINFLPEKNCCFINFTNISNAILAIEKIKTHSAFKDLKINFGKDRCGNIPHQIR